MLVKLIIALALAAAGFGAGWSVNGWRLGEAIAQRERDAQAAVDAARVAADAKTKGAQDAADQRALALSQQLTEVTHANDAALDQARRALRLVKPCPVPVSVVGLLVTAPAAAGGAVPESAGVAGRVAPAGGAVATAAPTIDAAAVIESCEVNRGIFERNRVRLDACRAVYEAVRVQVNGP